MESADISVLKHALDWRTAAHAVTLVTVVRTWGSAPRPPGALLAIRGDGVVAGSVSGGCVEDDLIDRIRRGERAMAPRLIRYGVSREEAARFGLPCGGTLELVEEPLTDARWIARLFDCTARGELVRRELRMVDGAVSLRAGERNDALHFDGNTLAVTFGPRWRLLLIGAGQLSMCVAGIARALDFEVLVCDPREEFRALLDASVARWLPGMPDDVVLDIGVDAHTAIVALTHDPKLDDMALMEALRSDAFYVGALGSRRNSQKRRERLQEFDLSARQTARLHGPVGLHIGGQTPAEIAVSIVAEIVAVKNGIPLLQKKREEQHDATAESSLDGDTSCSSATSSDTSATRSSPSSQARVCPIA
ncbi:lipoprotein [Caballeronia hypogeia]|uniref:Lipoprotein n=1 Tax=Caballeronia hypogeia TaxID=1777140 RepID=A0A157ZMA0_9BURK|nr:XdhC family protein [Caballeronia hypogeia]SAK46077.1 lipoprotein [Caballeronia hypogeia]